VAIIIIIIITIITIMIINMITIIIILVFNVIVIDKQTVWRRGGRKAQGMKGQLKKSSR